MMLQPDDVSKTDNLFPLSPVGSEVEGVKPAAPGFASLMGQVNPGAASPLGAPKESGLISPFELVQGKAPLAQAPTAGTLLAQVNQAQSTLGDLNTYIGYKDLKLKSSQKYVLGNKLSDAMMNLKAANTKMGAVVKEPPEASQFKGPLGKFIALLTDGQYQLEAAKHQLQDLKNKGQQLSPGDFLLIQVKLNKAQQELDFSSVLLSNAVQDFKLLMQVQL